ncbi:MAG: hypothetical protein AAF602_28210, partial [Myxococcota bacterium]
MSGLRRPKLVASVLFDVPNGPNPLSSDLWWTAADRRRSDPPVDEDVFEELHRFCGKHGLQPVAVTPVGFSFAAPPDDLAKLFSLGQVDDVGGYHPQRVGPRIVRPVPDAAPTGAWAELASLGVSALEIGVAARGVGGPSRRELLWGAAASGALAACQPVAPPWSGTCDVAPSGLPAGTAIPTEVGQLRALLGLKDSNEAERDESPGIIAVVDSGYGGRAFTGLERVAIADLDNDEDEDGHGTAVVEHLRAVAPGFDIRMSKYADLSGFRNYPV